MKPVARSLLVLAIGIGFLQTPAAVAAYSVVDLGPCPVAGFQSNVYAINDFGQIAGTWYTPGGDRHAGIWQNGVVTDLGTLGGSESSGCAIDGNGRVAGWARLADVSPHASVWDVNGSVTDLGTLGGGASYADGMNDFGQVVGHSYTASGYIWPFRYGGGVMTALAGGSGAAYAVNDAGTAVGKSNFRPVLWASPDVVTDLGTLGGSVGGWVGCAQDTNNSGKVVGWAVNASSELRAFLWQDGVMNDLGTLGGTNSRAYGINDAGQVVGYAEKPGAGVRAFLWEDGVMLDLNDMIPAGSGWVLQHAVDINEAGWIVGYGIKADNKTYGFLLVPEPATLALLALGGVGVLLKRRARTRTG